MLESGQFIENGLKGVRLESEKNFKHLYLSKHITQT